MIVSGDIDIEWVVPRCSHGHIILACPHDDCPEQNEYLAQQEAAMDAWDERMRRGAREILGLPVED